MEFLVDTGMELARHIIFKVFDLATEQATASVAARKNAQLVRSCLEPQLDKIQSQIKDLAEGLYKTSLSHLYHALTILRERYDELDLPPDQKGTSAILVGLRKDQAIPSTAVDLLRMSYDKAINAFHSSGNLTPEKRIKALQVAVLCIGIQHVQEPRVVLSRWRQCLHDAFSDEAIAKCIEQNVDMGRFRRFFSSNKGEDLDAFLIFARDLLTQIARIAARDETDRDTVKDTVSQIAYPAELEKETREKWAEKVDWTEFANFIKYRDELKVKQAGAPFDACAALPDGGIVVAMGNDAIIQYSRDFEKTNFKAGAYYSLAYDAHQGVIWGFSKKKNSMIALDMQNLEPTGQEIHAPNVDGDVRIARWHMAITLSGSIVLAAQFLREKDTKQNPQIIFAKTATDDEWKKLNIDVFLPRSKITDISAMDKESKENDTMIALALDDAFYLLHCKISTNEPVPQITVNDVEHLLADKLRDTMSCTFDEQGNLIVVVRRQTINIIDPSKKSIIKKDFALRASGNWVASGQRALWTPTLTGDITQYEYFLM